MLQIVDKIKQGSRNKHAGWAEANPHHYALVDAILEADIHIIGTVRGKPASAEGSDLDPIFDNLGIAPDQRGNFLYELDIVGVMDHANILHVSKSRADTIQNLDLVTPDQMDAKDRPKQGRSINYKQMAGQLMTWANKGVDPALMFFRDKDMVRDWLTDLMPDDADDINTFAKDVLGYMNADHNSGFDKLSFFAESYTREQATEVVKKALNKGS